MSNQIEIRIKELGITLPEPVASVANYVPWVKSGNLVFISGQITMENGELKYVGKLGDSMTTEEGSEAANLCGRNLIAQLRAACGGDLDRVRRVVKLGGFVACTPEFTNHPKVINGASDLMVDVFGDAGRHARSAVGVPSLPLGIAVEIDGIFEIE